MAKDYSALGNVVPGEFTGVYTGSVRQTALPSNSLTKVAPPTTSPVSFKQALKEVTNKTGLTSNKPLFYVSQKVQNVPNYLPFTSLVGAEVGPYGLIFANSVLKLCQYYKKSNLQPRSF